MTYLLQNHWISLYQHTNCDTVQNYTCWQDFIDRLKDACHRDNVEYFKENPKTGFKNNGLMNFAAHLENVFLTEHSVMKEPNLVFSIGGFDLFELV